MTLPARTVRRWRDRKSVRTLLREFRQYKWRDDLAREENAESRLPSVEKVHLGGIVLAEVFTPSTVAALHNAIRNLPLKRPGEREDILAFLAKGRYASSGFQPVGMVRRPGDFLLEGYHDPAVPDGVQGISLSLTYPVPSVTALIATFILAESAGDLSWILRGDYEPSESRPRLHIPGRWGRLRSRIPWVRPRAYTLRGSSMYGVFHQKEAACDALMEKYEVACWNWLTATFSGRLGKEAGPNRPAVRLIFTSATAPFSDEYPWFRPLGLDFPLYWQSEPVGWGIATPVLPDTPFRMVVAGRRKDIRTGTGTGTRTGTGDDSNWFLAQVFHDEHQSLITQWAMSCLMSIYIERLAKLRDSAGKRGRMARPVRQALDLDRYLLGDGLDTSTVIADAASFAATRAGSGWDGYNYIQRSSRASVSVPDPPRDLNSTYTNFLKSQTDRVTRDAKNVTANIAASAELRQAVANTRLQRFVIVLTIVTVVIAVVGLVVALQASSTGK